jgi:hypothetical protein
MDKPKDGNVNAKTEYKDGWLIIREEDNLMGTPVRIIHFWIDMAQFSQFLPSTFHSIQTRSAT